MVKEIAKLLGDPTISIIMTIMGLLLASIGIYYTIKYRQIKRLIITDWENKEIFSLTKLREKDIRILYKNIEINGLHELNITLKNTGTVVLKNDDFYQKPIITFLSDVQILDVEVNCLEEYINPTIDINVKEIILNFEFLEPKDKISLKVLYNSKTVSGGKIFGKIIGGNKINSFFRTDKEYEAYREGKAIGKTIYMFIAGLIFVFLNSKITKYSYNYTKLSQSLLNILAFMISIFISFMFGKVIQTKIEKRRIKKLIQEGELETNSLHYFIKKDI